MTYHLNGSRLWNHQQLAVVRELIKRGIQNKQMWEQPELRKVRPGVTLGAAEAIARRIRDKIKSKQLTTA